MVWMIRYVSVAAGSINYGFDVLERNTMAGVIWRIACG